MLSRHLHLPCVYTDYKTNRQVRTPVPLPAIWPYGGVIRLEPMGVWAEVYWTTTALGFRGDSIKTCKSEQTVYILFRCRLSFCVRLCYPVIKNDIQL